MNTNKAVVLALGLTLLSAGTLRAAAFTFSTGDPDGRIATGSRPPSAGLVEIETADDFILTSPTVISSATFTGLIPAGIPVSALDVSISFYRVFPNDSVQPPSGNVPVRANSPSDNELVNVTLSGGNLTSTPNLLNPAFNAANSVLNGIHKVPNQNTLGEGPVSGQEVRFDVVFTPAITLPADHYFFVPQVELGPGAAPLNFLWLSTAKPIVAPGTPFVGDLQAWIRNTDLDPDWLRVGTDIVGGNPAPTFNMAFTLNGETVPEPGCLVFGVTGLTLLIARRRAGR